MAKPIPFGHGCSGSRTIWWSITTVLGKDNVSLTDASPQLEQKASRDEIRPEQVLGEFVTMERVRHAISRLTEEQQQVLVLRFFEGLSTGEVAELLGKRRGAIRGLQFRALSALRDLLYREQEAVT